MRGMRAARLGASVEQLAILGACANSTSREAASCIAPYIDDQGPNGTYGSPAATVSPGDALTLCGHWYANACNDTDHATEVVGPLPAARLTLRLPDGSTREVGPRTPAGHELGFSVTVHAPASAKTGPASVPTIGRHLRSTTSPCSPSSPLRSALRPSRASLQTLSSAAGRSGR